MAEAQLDTNLPLEKTIDAFRHHVIVLVDRSGSMKRNVLESEMKRLFTEQLSKILYDSAEVLPDRPLLLEKDFLSVAYFGLGKFNNYDYKHYILQELQTGNAGNYGTSFSRAVDREVINSLWAQIGRNYHSFFSGNFTGLSFAGPSGFHFFKGKERKVHRTFVLLVSDGQFHSIDDPSSELAMKSVFDRNGNLHRFKSNEYIEGVYADVKTNYNWHPELYSEKYNKFELKVFEYIPNQVGLAIRSKLDFPVEVQVDRTPDGYQKTFTVSDQDRGDAFDPRQVLVQLLDSKSGDTISQHLHPFKDGVSRFDLEEFSSKPAGDSLLMQLSFWMDYNDEVYGGFQLHPFGSTAQGADGLKESITLYFEKEGRILGFLSFPNSLYRFSSGFRGTSQSRNILFWNGLLIFLLTLTLAGYTLWYIIRTRIISDPSQVSIQTISGARIIG